MTKFNIKSEIFISRFKFTSQISKYLLTSVKFLNDVTVLRIMQFLVFFTNIVYSVFFYLFKERFLYLKKKIKNNYLFLDFYQKMLAKMDLSSFSLNKEFYMQLDIM